MKIKTIIEKVKSIYENLDTQKIINLYELVIYDLTNFFPLEEEEFFIESEISYKDFKKIPQNILDCENETYMVNPQSVESKDKKSLGKIRYTFVPNSKQIDENSDCPYDESFLNIIVCGIHAEYALTLAMFKEAVTWHEKQINLIRDKMKKDKEMEKKKNEISRQV